MSSVFPFLLGSRADLMLSIGVALCVHSVRHHYYHWLPCMTRHCSACCLSSFLDYLQPYGTGELDLSTLDDISQRGAQIMPCAPGSVTGGEPKLYGISQVEAKIISRVPRERCYGRGRELHRLSGFKGGSLNYIVFSAKRLGRSSNYVRGLDEKTTI